MIRPALAFALTASIAAFSAAHAQCPPNYVGSYLTGPSDTPIYAAVHRDSMGYFPNTYAWYANWDLTAGTAKCSGQTLCFGEGNAYSGDVGMYLTDDYVLTGPASSTPISFQAVMHVAGGAGSAYGYTCTTGYVSATLQEGAQSTYASGGGSCTNPSQGAVNTDLALSLSKSVGQHFQLNMALRAAPPCNGSSGMSSSLMFLLPPGYHVTSCYGFTSPAATGVVNTSWGRLKTLYR